MILRGTGRRYGISVAALAAVVFVGAGFSGAAAESLESFLLPGVDIRSVDLTVGKWCRYLVVDEAEGIRDSVVVYVAVLGQETVDGEDAFWLEFELAPVGSALDDRDVTRVLISSDIKDLSQGDSLYHYVREMYVKRGEQPVAPADPRDLRRLTLTDSASDAEWIAGEPEAVATPMGSIVCDRKELLLEETREVPAGRKRPTFHAVRA